MSWFLVLIPWWLLVVAIVIAAGALVMTLVNFRFFTRSRKDAPVPPDAPSVGVCIPARNEQDNIGACVAAILANDYPNLRVVVYDDQSEDDTPRIIDELIQRDPRVGRAQTRPLPAGWIGKQWACWQLAHSCHSDLLLFLDADVRLSADCLRRAVDARRSLNAELLSTFPRQITRSLGESLLVPMIFFILLSYLPFGRMRRSNPPDPNASAACGQFILVSRAAYFSVGGHETCRNSMHEGVKLPRVFRRSGFHTDLFDGTDVLSCRMYRGFASTWRGFAKNAFEGLGSPALLIFITILHLVGHVLPWLVLAATLFEGQIPSIHFGLALAAVLIAFVQRIVLSRRFAHPLWLAPLHPIGVLLMTLVQWHSFLLALTGRRGWRGRSASPVATSSPA
ncbi:MAG: glycosyltransferase family 2 protein [Phycisphaerales bacterium]|nr:glycosyltransferase family 2 protein [Phycisphaerales bacterium]